MFHLAYLNQLKSVAGFSRWSILFLGFWARAEQLSIG